MVFWRDATRDRIIRRLLLRALRIDTKEVLELIQRHMSLATYRMSALGNVVTKSRSFFVAERVSSVASAWS